MNSDVAAKNAKMIDWLGWTPEDWGYPVYTDIEERIRTFQVREGLTVDGVAGPKTYARFLDTQFQTGLFSPITAGQRAVGIAKRQWLDNIVDPPTLSTEYDASRKRINEYIKGKSGLNWGWEPDYTKDGIFAWCGAFIAWVYGQLGLNPDIRKTFCSSTDRLDCLGRGIPHNGHPPPVGKRLYIRMDQNSLPAGIEDDDVRPGDILLVGNDHSAYGSHITMVESYDGKGTFHTIEGNGKGNGPKIYMEGVIRGTRPLGQRPDTSFHARRLLRFAPTDFGA